MTTIHTLTDRMLEAFDKSQECKGSEAGRQFEAQFHEALHQLVSQYGWRDMESAPKDGKNVLARRNETLMGECYFAGEWKYCGFPVCNLTAWMPLPTANPGGSAPRGEG